jgi:hypothetical protein
MASEEAVLMRKWIARSIVSLLVLLSVSLAVMGQEQGLRKPPPGFVMAGVPEMPTPPGPAPKRDLTGAWVGPIKLIIGPYPEMTPAGKAAFSQNKPVPEAVLAGAPRAGQAQPDSVGATNDPFMLCDPLGFPRDLLNHAVSMRGGLLFEPVPKRMLILFEQQHVWREIWMDGRQLPEKVDAKGYPDSRYYGYSVGHWEGDNTFVIETTGLDPKTWLEERGHPHTNAAHIEERWTRLDQYNVQATVTVDDPKYYAKPFQLMQAHYYWMKDQEFDEALCVPSEAIEYRDKLAKPAGWGPGDVDGEAK